MKDIPLSSTEIGNLWQAYQEKSMKLHVLDRFIQQSKDKNAKKILQSNYDVEFKNQQTLQGIFQNENMALPVAFTESDINKEAPLLFDDDFHMMYFYLSSQILAGLYVLHTGMSYRKDIHKLYEDFTADSQTFHYNTTQYLLNKGVLARPPIVSKPTKVEFVGDTGYTSGFNPLKNLRPLNTVEIGLVYQSLELNMIGSKLMMGFAQVAEDTDVQRYFTRGKDLAKKNVTTMSELFWGSDIQAPSAWGGVVTDSTISPFSDKLMMYNVNLFSAFAMGGSAAGGGFSFRNDLLAKLGRIVVNTSDFVHDGAKLRIKKGWMEQPPQAIDRDKIVKGK